MPPRWPSIVLRGAVTTKEAAPAGVAGGVTAAAGATWAISGGGAGGRPVRSGGGVLAASRGAGCWAGSRAGGPGLTLWAAAGARVGANPPGWGPGRPAREPKPAGDRSRGRPRENAARPTPPGENRRRALN